jgi:shikimate kinase
MVPERVCLCGFMGSGKTTVGTALARRLDYDFVDLDARIEQIEGQSIAQIFHASGEACFRELEEREGLAMLKRNRIVVGLGGGALASPRLLQAVCRSSFLVYLTAPPAELYRRTRAHGERPLLARAPCYSEFLQVFEARMIERQPGYERAELQVDTDGLMPDQVAERIWQALRTAPADA